MSASETYRCEACGAAFAVPAVYCTSCAVENEPGRETCVHCGTTLAVRRPPRCRLCGSADVTRT